MEKSRLYLIKTEHWEGWNTSICPRSRWERICSKLCRNGADCWGWKYFFFVPIFGKNRSIKLFSYYNVLKFNQKFHGLRTNHILFISIKIHLFFLMILKISSKLNNLCQTETAFLNQNWYTLGFLKYSAKNLTKIRMLAISPYFAACLSTIKHCFIYG